MKLTFLGSASAFSVGMQNYQSNMILQVDSDYLLIDCGSDARHALHEQGLTGTEIDSVFCSHLHADHVGGLEWLAQLNFFTHDPSQKLNLFIADDLAFDLWHHVLSGGLSSLQHETASMQTFFKVHAIEKNEAGKRLFSWKNIHFEMVRVEHVYSNHQALPCDGLWIQAPQKNIWISGDLIFNFEKLKPHYENADLIFHDCETKDKRSGVHAHYSDLCTLPLEIKQKMWLYDYNSNTLPDANRDGFLGFVKKGQVFEF